VRRVGEVLGQQRFELLGFGNEFFGPRDVVGVGEPECDPIVRPDHVDVGAVPLTQPLGGRHRPRGVDLRSEGREDHYAPVADLVAEPLHDQRLIRRKDAALAPFLFQIRDEVLGGQLVEVVFVCESTFGGLR
jgi:hypothetical protein